MSFEILVDVAKSDCTRNPVRPLQAHRHGPVQVLCHSNYTATEDTVVLTHDPESGFNSHTSEICLADKYKYMY
jgi:hypothetical protein